MTASQVEVNEIQELSQSTETPIRRMGQNNDNRSKCSKERRNGLWNIFEGVDSTDLEHMGLSVKLVHELVTGADETVSECLSLLTTTTAAPAGDRDCRCERVRTYRSSSTTVGEEMQAAMQNRHRRNAVGNLFEALTLSQKLLLVENLQLQLERLNILCVDRGDDNDIILSLSSGLSSSSSNGTSKGSTPRSVSEIVCR